MPDLVSLWAIRLISAAVTPGFERAQLPAGVPEYFRPPHAPHADFAGLSHRPKRGSLSAMSATLTINLDADVLQLAEQEARSRDTTLPEVVAHQLRVMARNWQESKAGKTPVTDALRGAVKLPPDFDERMTLTEELQKQHGVQG